MEEFDIAPIMYGQRDEEKERKNKLNELEIKSDSSPEERLERLEKLLMQQHEAIDELQAPADVNGDQNDARIKRLQTMFLQQQQTIDDLTNRNRSLERMVSAILRSARSTDSEIRNIHNELRRKVDRRS